MSWQHRVTRRCLRWKWNSTNSNYISSSMKLTLRINWRSLKVNSTMRWSICHKNRSWRESYIYIIIYFMYLHILKIHVWTLKVSSKFRRGWNIVFFLSDLDFFLKLFFYVFLLYKMHEYLEHLSEDCFYIGCEVFWRSRIDGRVSKSFCLIIDL